MKTIKLQATIEISYETPNGMSSEKLENDVRRALEHQIYLTTSGNVDISEWNLQIKTANPEKEKLLVQTHKNTPLGVVSAYFSSDGPALNFSMLDRFPGTVGMDPDLLPMFFHEVTSALREVYHQYLRTTRE
jgi:hypothetical protein